MALTKVQNEMLTSGGGGGGSSLGDFQSKTTTYTVLSTDGFIDADTSGGSWTATLPTASDFGGKFLILKKTTSDFNILTIARASSDTILDEAASLTSVKLYTIGETITLTSDGSTTWYVVERNIPMKITTYTPGTNGLGTVTINYASWQRDSKSSLLFRANITVGTPAASAARVDLPSGLHCYDPGVLLSLGGAEWSFVGSAFPITLLAETGNPAYISLGYAAAGSFTPANGNAIFAAGNTFGYNVSVQINEWQ